MTSLEKALRAQTLAYLNSAGTVDDAELKQLAMRLDGRLAEDVCELLDRRARVESGETRDRAAVAALIDAWHKVAESVAMTAEDDSDVQLTLDDFPEAWAA